jgi:hypothetical protein
MSQNDPPTVDLEHVVNDRHLLMRIVVAAESLVMLVNETVISTQLVVQICHAN